MTRTLKVKSVVPFPVGRDEVHMYYRFEECDELEVGQVVHLAEPEPAVDESIVCIEQASSKRELDFYDLGTSETMDAMASLLSGQSRDGVSQRQWQMLKEQVWQLQDLAETCKDLENVNAGSGQWWYRIDGATGNVVLFQLSGEERELIVGGVFDNDLQKGEFAKTIATLINLSQEAHHSLKARSMAKSLFESVRKRGKDKSVEDL